MKKFKLLPSILMLILCVGVLAVGIYAASPTSHSVVGTVNISAGGANVSITGYLDDGDGDFSDDVKVTNTYTSRTAKTISIYANALDFDCSSATDASQVPEKKLYFKIENHASFDLGAYFLQGVVGEDGTVSENIAETKNFNGKMGATTITNLITATFSPYTKIASDDVAYLYSTLKLNQINQAASTVVFNLNLNIERYNQELASPALGGSVTISNIQDLDFEVSCVLENAIGESTSSLTNTGVWNIENLAFSDERFCGQLRLLTVKAKMIIKNNHTAGIMANVRLAINSPEPDPEKIKVTTVGNPYIAPGKTGEVSIQFSAVYDRANGELTLPTIPECHYKLEVDAAGASNIDVKYNSSALEGENPSRFYVEFGEKPGIHYPKLRWYIWAKEDGNGGLKPIDSLDYDTVTKKFKGKGTYYFISEDILDTESDGNGNTMGISYQNEVDVDGLNPDGVGASDYAGSNLRKYLNGTTVKNFYYENEDCDKLPDGSYVNFYDRYSLTQYEIFNSITPRSLQDMYKGNKYCSLLDKYSQESDKFWPISYNDCYYLTRLSTNKDLYQMKADLGLGGGSFWLQGGIGTATLAVNATGYMHAFTASYDVGVRPCFALTFA